MNVTQTKFTLINLRPRRSVLLRGRHGIGKSEVVRQCAQERSQKENIPYEVIDIRLSQRESGDVIGIPRTVDEYRVIRHVYVNGEQKEQEVVLKNTTIHDLPSWFPRDPNSHGYILFDEIDRANREVQQSAFEAVLDYRINMHDIPKGWHVVAAANADMDIYTVLEMDPALLDRFLVIDLEPTVPEWMSHAESIGVHDAVIKYITKFDTDLFSPEDLQPGEIYPSPRSWVNLSRDLQHYNSVGHDLLKDLDYLMLLAKGCVGSTTAINFVEFIRKDYKTLTPEDILNRFNEEMERLVTQAESTETSFYCKNLTTYLKKNTENLSSNQLGNLYRFFRALPREVAGGFWSGMTRDCRAHATKFHGYKDVADYVMEILSVRGTK